MASYSENPQLAIRGRLLEQAVDFEQYLRDAITQGIDITYGLNSGGVTERPKWSRPG